MKNLFVLSAIAIGLFLGNQNVNAQSKVSETITKEVATQEDYVEVAIENLPQSVLDAVAKNFTDSKIKKAFANEDASDFKLQLAQKDGKIKEVHYDADGEIVNQK